MTDYIVYVAYFGFNLFCVCAKSHSNHNNVQLILQFNKNSVAIILAL